MTRVAVRELAAVAPLEETTGNFHRSQRFAFVACSNFGTLNCGNVTGSPKAEFAILALGKLGGGELNHSSTLTFFFSTATKANSRRTFLTISFFNRLGNKILRNIRSRIPPARCFEWTAVASRSSAGPLARSPREHG